MKNRKESLYVHIAATAAIMILLTAVWKSRRTSGPIRTELENFIGTTVTLPGDSSAHSAYATLVVYYDTATCATCLLGRIGEWNGLLAATDSFRSFRPLFIFSPKRDDADNYRRELGHAALRYDVYSDYDGTFHSSNPSLPDSRTLNIFLLDAENKVVLAGNPLHNGILWDLYLDYIAELCSNGGRFSAGFAGRMAQRTSERNDPGNGLTVAVPVSELGDVSIGQEISAAFVLKNASGSGISFEHILTDCDCVTAGVSPASLEPGQSGIVTVRFTPDNEGRFEKYIFVRTDRSEEETVLTIKGRAI